MLMQITPPVWKGFAAQARTANLEDMRPRDGTGEERAAQKADRHYSAYDTKCSCPVGLGNYVSLHMQASSPNSPNELCYEKSS